MEHATTKTTAGKTPKAKRTPKAKTPKCRFCAYFKRLGFGKLCDEHAKKQGSDAAEIVTVAP